MFPDITPTEPWFLGGRRSMAQRAARRGPLLVLYAFAHGRLPGLAV